MKSFERYLFKNSCDLNLVAESFVHKKYKCYDIHFIFVHGALEHFGRHERFIKGMLELFPKSCISGYDQIGHGKSAGSRSHIDSFEVLVKDLDLFIGEATQRIEAKKVVLIGYSMGGLVALDYLNQKSFDLYGCILVNPCLKLGKESFGTFLEKINLKEIPFLGKLRIPSLTRGITLSNDDKVIAEIEGDELRNSFVSYQFLRELVGASQRVRKAQSENHVPCLFLVSEADVIVNPEITKIYVKSLKKESICIKCYQHAKHDLLNEVNRDQVYSDISDWLQGSMSA